MPKCRFPSRLTHSRLRPAGAGAGLPLLIANTRRYWITVDVVRNLNTDEEEENASYVDLDLWMGYFIEVLCYNNPLMSACSRGA